MFLYFNMDNNLLEKKNIEEENKRLRELMKQGYTTYNRRPNVYDLNSNNDSDIKLKDKKSIEEERIKCEAMIINLLKSKLDDYIKNLSTKDTNNIEFTEIYYKYRYYNKSNTYEGTCKGKDVTLSYDEQTKKLEKLPKQKWFYNKEYNYFSFTKPLIEINDYNGILREKRNYKDKLKVGDKVFIFARLDWKQKEDHLTILIIGNDGEVYTIGFGYNEYAPKIKHYPSFLDVFDKKHSSVLLPDYQFELQMFRQTCNDSLNLKNKYLKLIASTILTSDFKNNLFNILDNIKFTDTNINRIDYSLFEWNSKDINNNIKTYNEKLLKAMEPVENNYMMDLPYKELKLKKDSSLFYIFEHYYMNIPDLQYCRVSPKGTKHQNCSSFIANIFDNILDCSYKGLPVEWFVVVPEFCKQSSKSTPLKCRDTIDLSKKYWDKQKQSKTQSIFKDVTKQKVTNVPVEDKSEKLGFWDRLTGKTNKERLEECEQIVLNNINLNVVTQRNDEINNYIKKIKSLTKYNDIIYTLNNDYDINIKNQVPGVWSFKNEHLHNYVYSLPIVTFENNKVINHIDEINIGDRINIWTTYNKFSISEKKAHICCQIITKNNKNFTFGFGTDYMECIGRFQKNNNIANTFLKQKFSKCKLIFNTPDSIFEKKLLYQKSHPNRRYVKLIGSSNINSEQIENIKKIIDNLEINNINLEIIRIKHNLFNDQIQNKIKIINQEVINLFNNTRNKNYINNASIIELNKNDMFCIYNSFEFKIPNLQYCAFSSKSKESYNCSSIIFDLFKDVITCGGSIIENIIVHPALCSQRKNIKVPKCSKTTTSKKQSYTKKTSKNIGFFGRIINRLTPKRTEQLKDNSKSKDKKVIPRSPNATPTPSISNSNSSSTLVPEKPKSKTKSKVNQIKSPVLNKKKTINKKNKLPWYNKLKFWKRTKKNNKK